MFPPGTGDFLPSRGDGMRDHKDSPSPWSNALQTAVKVNKQIVWLTQT